MTPWRHYFACLVSELGMDRWAIMICCGMPGILSFVWVFFSFGPRSVSGLD